MGNLLKILLVLLLSIPAFAQYPVKPVRVINLFPAGGSGDLVCRIIISSLTETFSKQFIVDTRAGAHGNIGANIVVKANPDGYTLLFATNTIFSTNPFFYKEQSVSVDQFSPIIRLGTIPNVLVIHPSLPPDTLQEFISYTKQNHLAYASAGEGSSMHMAALLYQQMTGTTMWHVPYVSPGQAMLDTVANRTQLIFHLVPVIAQQVQAGKLKALTTLATSRSSLLPLVPTSKEVGLPGLESGAEYMVLSPLGTPAPIIKKLNEELNIALKSTRLAEIGMTVSGGNPIEVITSINNEKKKWTQITKHFQPQSP